MNSGLLGWRQEYSSSQRPCYGFDWPTPRNGERDCSYNCEKSNESHPSPADNENPGNRYGAALARHSSELYAPQVARARNRQCTSDQDCYRNRHSRRGDNAAAAATPLPYDQDNHYDDDRVKQRGRIFCCIRSGETYPGAAQPARGNAWSFWPEPIAHLAMQPPQAGRGPSHRRSRTRPGTEQNLSRRKVRLRISAARRSKIRLVTPCSSTVAPSMKHSERPRAAARPPTMSAAARERRVDHWSAGKKRWEVARCLSAMQPMRPLHLARPQIKRLIAKRCVGPEHAER